MLRTYLALLPTYQRSLRCDYLAISGQGLLDFDYGPTPDRIVHPLFNAVIHDNHRLVLVQVHVALLVLTQHHATQPRIVCYVTFPAIGMIR